MPVLLYKEGRRAPGKKGPELRYPEKGHGLTARPEPRGPTLWWTSD